MLDDNVAYNGEVYVCAGLRVPFSHGPREMYLLEDQDRYRIIPWEVDPSVT